MNKIYYKGLLLVFGALIATVAASCNDDEVDGNKFQSSMAQCLTRSEDVNSHTVIFSKMSFVADYDNDNGTVDITIVGMEVPVAGSSSGVIVPRMQLNGLIWKYNSQGWKIVEATNVSPVVEGMSIVPTFDSVSFCIADVFDNTGQYRPGIQYVFDLNYNNSKYHLEGTCMTGTTTATSPSGVSYTPEDDSSVAQKPTYWLDFDFASSTADLYLFNAKFLDRMPSLNLVFPDIPYTTSNGTITLNCEALTPLFGQTPFPSFPISKLTGNMDFTTSTLSLDFVCNYSGDNYDVKIVCKY